MGRIGLGGRLDAEYHNTILYNLLVYQIDTAVFVKKKIFRIDAACCVKLREKASCIPTPSNATLDSENFSPPHLISFRRAQCIHIIIGSQYQKLKTCYVQIIWTIEPISVYVTKERLVSGLAHYL
jgi:hypothetical protein